VYLPKCVVSRMVYPDNDELVYKRSLVSVMCFVHGVDYRRDRQYTKGELRALTPDGIVRWMNLKTFGIPDTPIDANPMFAHSNTLVFWRKAISFFMPDCLALWVSGCSKGNPTWSIDVNNLIRRFKKKGSPNAGCSFQGQTSIVRS
jgi:hypothetical protein